MKYLKDYYDAQTILTISLIIGKKKKRPRVMQYFIIFFYCFKIVKYV